MIKIVWMECAIWELGNLCIVNQMQFSVRDGSVKFKVSYSQNFLGRKGVSHRFYSEIYGLQKQMGVANFSRKARPKSEQDLHH